MSTSVRSTHTKLSRIPFDPEFTPGAHNAVNVCLRIQPQERVCVITDEATSEIAAAMVAELEKLALPYHAWIIEELAARPLVDMPREILDDLDQSAQPGMVAAVALEQPHSFVERSR